MGIQIEKINEKFRLLGEQVVERRWLFLGVFALLVVFSFVGMSGLKANYSNDSWFLDNDPLIVVEDKLKEVFGNNTNCAVLIEGEDIFKKNTLEKIRELGIELESKVPYADDIISVADLEFLDGVEGGMNVDQLIGDPVPSDKAVLSLLKQKALSKPAIYNKLISSSGDESWIILRLLNYPEDWNSDSNHLKYIQREAELYPGLYKGIDVSKPLDPEDIAGVIFKRIVRQDYYKVLNPTAAGLPVLVSDKREFFANETPRLMLLGLLISVLVLAITLRSLRGVIFPIITAVASMIITFGIEGYLEVEFDPSMILIPAFLGLAVAVGYSIHVFSFYRQNLDKSGNRKDAAVKAVEEIGWPLLFTALTTIAALISFQLIDVKTLRWVGMTSSFMVAVTYAVSVFIFPALLSFGKNKDINYKTKNKERALFPGMLTSFGKWTTGNPLKIIAVYIGFSIICIYGIMKVEVSFDIKESMGEKIPYVARNLHVGDSDLGSIYSYDVGIEFNNPGDAKDPENLKKFDKMVEKIESFSLTKNTSSLLDVLKDINVVLNDNDYEYYRVPDTKEMVAQMLLLYENAGGVEAEKWVDYDYQRLHAAVNLKYYNSKEAVREFSEIRKLAGELFPGADVVLYGSMPKFTDMMQKVSWGQIKAFLISLVIISILMMLVFGSFTTGLIGMIPNISPALAVGGIMGIFGIPLDMMTCTVMPMIMGLAVDDTIHFINHTQLEYLKTGDRRKSVIQTFRRVCPALIMTSAVLILNFSAYTTSTAKFYLHFGVLTSAGIFAALVADLFVTPALMILQKDNNSSVLISSRRKIAG